VGTQRPINPAVGSMRYNTDTHQMELYDGANWMVVAESKPKPNPWRQWYAWYPVRVHGRWKWLTTVYRYKTNTYVNHDDWAVYEYGTIFDAIRDAQ